MIHEEWCRHFVGEKLPQKRTILEPYAFHLNVVRYQRFWIHISLSKIINEALF